MTAALAIAPIDAAAGPDGAALLAALHAEAFADPAVSGPAWDAAAFAALLATPGTLALVAMRGTDPLGLLLLRTVADEAEILTLGVSPGARRAGVAAALVAAALAQGTAAGAARLFLEVAETNGPARALYAGLGFSPVGRRPGYFQLGGRPVAALVLARPLP